MDRGKEKPMWFDYDPSFPMLLEAHKWFLFSIFFFFFDNLDMVLFLDKAKLNLIFLSLTQEKIIFTIKFYMF